jgi:small-conductance mechanosensitive channel
MHSIDSAPTAEDTCVPPCKSPAVSATPARIRKSALGCLLILLLLLSFSATGANQDIPPDLTITQEALTASIKLQKTLRKKEKALRKEIGKTVTQSHKKALLQKLEVLEKEISSATQDFEFMAAGTDVSSLWQSQEATFNFQQEFLALLKPAIDEMKQMTTGVRVKSELRERIANLEERLPIATKAMESIDTLLQHSKNQLLLKELARTRKKWATQKSIIESQLNSARLQLDKINSADISFAEKSQGYLKDFFQKRGLYLATAVLIMLAVFFASRIIYSLIIRFLPGFSKLQRSFQIRLFDLSYRILTFASLLITPILVFYFAEDWLLLSLSILFLIGIGWTLTHTLPRYWQQIQLFLNIGSVREGERIIMDGLPWQVKQINVFTRLENPVAGLRQRVPIAHLIDMKSRPVHYDEPWFPCHRGDWVVLSDGYFARVTGISLELVELTDKGGAHKTYPTATFLELAPRNLSTNFRLSQVVGISYDLQEASTRKIPEMLHQHLMEQIEKEGYSDHLIRLQVEFMEANTSSLDLTVLMDISGEMGKNYQKLQRAINRWSVDACTINGWEIPFTQITLHKA